MRNLPNPNNFGKYYNTQPNKVPFRTKNMKGTLWRLEQKEWEVYFKINGLWHCLILFEGYTSDLASIPWIAQPLLKKGKDGVHRSFAASHDFPYVMPKIKINNKWYASIEHKSCTHELYAFVDNNWVAYDMLMSKEEADNMAFEVWKSTPESYSPNWKKRAMAAAFLTPIAHKMWKRHWTLNETNPLLCQEKKN